MQVKESISSFFHKEISGTFVFTCEITQPNPERIFNRDYVFELATKSLRKDHALLESDDIELTSTEFHVAEQSEDKMVCTLLGDFKIKRNQPKRVSLLLLYKDED